MFSKWGDFVQRHRKLVLVLMILLVTGLGIIGQKLPDYLSQSGWFDPNSDSIKAAEIEESTFGRDNSADVVVLYDAPDGKTVDDKAFAKKVQSHLDQVAADNPQYIDGIASYWNTKQAMLATADKKHAMASIRLKGEGNNILKNYRKVEDKIPVPGVSQHIAGQTPVSGALDTGMAKDIKRAELAGLPIVGVLLVIVFGGLVAALLPLLVGALSISGSTGILTLIGMTTEVNAFAQSCVTLIGLGLAIDYALFIVSRFREELAEGYDTHTAVTRTVATAGRTVVFSAIMVGVALSSMLIFPQAFLKSVAYGSISAVVQAALLSLTILPILLSFLGKRVDMLSFNRHKKDPTPQQLYNGFWGKIAGAAMRRPVATLVPLIFILMLMALPMGNLKFGGINETYLPPDNTTRVAQETFDRTFPTMRTNPIKMVVVGSNGVQTGAILAEANQVKGLTGDFKVVKQTPVDAEGRATTVLQAGIVDMRDNSQVVKDLRHSLDVLYAGGGSSQFAGMDMSGTKVYVGGNPALEKDSISALLTHLPAMAVYMLVTIIILMFLTFGSLVLPIKAILMTLLSMASTLGVLTLIFIDGVGAQALNFTPGPMMSATLVLIVAILFGLSTDYEVFLVSRMVEAHAAGHSTQESIRFGTASTGRIITAAAAIMIMVTGAFGFSEIVMMKYIAFGMVIALFLDATVVRMLLVPAVMKILDDDNWWAPASLKRLQHRIGLSESELTDDPGKGMLAFGEAAAAAAAEEEAAGHTAKRIPASVVSAATSVDVPSVDVPSVGEPSVAAASPSVRTARRIDPALLTAGSPAPQASLGYGNAVEPLVLPGGPLPRPQASTTAAAEEEPEKPRGFFARRRAKKHAAMQAKVNSVRQAQKDAQREAQERARREAQAAAQAAALAAAEGSSGADPFATMFTPAADNDEVLAYSDAHAHYEDNYSGLFAHTDTQRASYAEDSYEDVSTAGNGLRIVRPRSATPATQPSPGDNASDDGSWTSSDHSDQPISTSELMRRLREDKDS